MQTIEIKEDLDDPKERARRAAAKRKQKEAEANMNSKNKMPVKMKINNNDTNSQMEHFFQSNKFTEEDIKTLVKTFKMDFPHGNINKRGTIEAIRKVFPR